MAKISDYKYFCCCRDASVADMQDFLTGIGILNRGGILVKSLEVEPRSFHRILAAINRGALDKEQMAAEVTKTSIKLNTPYGQVIIRNGKI